MAIRDFYTFAELGEYADMLPPRQYRKAPLIAYAETPRAYEEEVPTYTKVTVVGNAIVPNNYPLSIPITEIPLCLDACYDQLQRLWVSYITEGTLKLYWYDNAVSSFVTSDFGQADDAYLFIDDMRYFAQILSQSSAWLVYVRDLVIYARIQSDRFSVEYPIGELAVHEKLTGVGMNNLWRLQIVIANDLELQEPVEGGLVLIGVSVNDVPVSVGERSVIEAFVYGNLS